MFSEKKYSKSKLNGQSTPGWKSIFGPPEHEEVQRHQAKTDCKTIFLKYLSKYQFLKAQQIILILKY